MTADYRALCAELLLRLEESDDYILKEEGTIALADRARAALAEPDGPAVPEGREPASVVGEPSDEELLSLAADSFAPVLVHYARAVLARWGAPALTPVPVSERLPGPGDCDAEGRCWWWRTDNADEWWELLCISDAREYNAGCGNARYQNCAGTLLATPPHHTHWLPATALPLPAGEVQL